MIFPDRITNGDFDGVTFLYSGENFTRTAELESDDVIYNFFSGKLLQRIAPFTLLFLVSRHDAISY